MTREELEKEAEEKAKKRTKGFKCQDNCEKSYVMGALDFAEPREKRITELEAQIEKMKGCHNCRHLAEPYELCCYSLGDEDYDCRGRKWEIKENE